VVRLSARARRALIKARAVRLRVAVRVTDAAGNANAVVSPTQTFTVLA
jgi:hypothetical protein